MSRSRTGHQSTPEDSTHSAHDADGTEYQSMRGCLTLSVLTIICVIIAVVCIALFGTP